VLVGTSNGVIGAVSVADQVRPLSRSAVAGLRAAGVRYVTMLTGDNRQTAAAVAADLGLDDYQAELLPEHKVQAVRDIAATHGPVAMIGDGVNDAPALAAATVGIAMGAAGTDTALETADIALMADDLSKVPFTIELSRAARATVRQNITFALALKVVTLLLVFPGWLTLWMAVLADTGGSLIVIGNGLRLVRYGRRDASQAGAEPAGLPARRTARTSPSTAVAAGCSHGGCACTLSAHAEPGGHDHDRGPVAAGNRASV
jgi:Cd2+/Zn2+-exporting ATPase